MAEIVHTFLQEHLYRSALVIAICMGALHGNGLHRPDSLYGSPLPCLLYDMGRILRIL